MTEKFRFKPEDFCDDPDLVLGKAFARRANELLDAHLASCKKVYGQICLANDCWVFSEQPGTQDTHSALLWSIEPLEAKECVKHEPDFMTSRFDRNGEQSVSCKKCGAKLKATWSAE